MKFEKTREELYKENEFLKKELESLKEIRNGSMQKNICEDDKTHINEKMLQSVVEAAAGKIGQDFFDNIILRLSEWLGAECVLIGRMVENERIEAVPLLLDGEISHGFSYDLAGSPCDITTRKGYCTYSENVIELFPKDKILVDLQAESYIGTALYNKKGVVNGVICAVSRKKLITPPYAHDILKIIGARVTAELERQKMEEELRESNNAKDKYFSILAHDLQNPLNVLTGFADLLILRFDKLDIESIKKYIKQIHNATNNMNNLVSDLLTWSLTQQKMINTNLEEVNIKTKLLKTIEIVGSMANEKSISIKLDIPSDIYVIADKNMLSTVLRNLISNAIKFSHPESKIIVSADILKNENKLVVSVKDFGVGIEPKRIMRLFEIGHDTSTVGTNNEKGTGLGLILCKEFIEKQNGKIWVESEINLGSTFMFTLNLAD